MRPDICNKLIGLTGDHWRQLARPAGSLCAAQGALSNDSDIEPFLTLLATAFYLLKVLFLSALPAGAGGAGSAAASGGQAAAEAQAAAGAGAGLGGRGTKAVLEGLEELWDESQYAEELSLDAFVNKLR